MCPAIAPAPERIAVTTGKAPGSLGTSSSRSSTLPTDTPVAVDDLAVEQLEHGPQPAAARRRHEPAFVMIINGIVATRPRSATPCRRSRSCSAPDRSPCRPCTSRSFATTRIGKYVSGNAAAESTIEYSVTLIGSTAVSPTITATTDRRQHDEMEPGRLARRARASPTASRSTARSCSRTTVAVSSAAPNVHAKNPTMTNASPTLPSACATGRPTCDRLSTPTPTRLEHDGRAAHQAQREQAAEREPEEDVRAVQPEIGRLHFSSTAPDEKKNTSYGVIAAPNSAIA